MKTLTAIETYTTTSSLVLFSLKRYEEDADGAIFDASSLYISFFLLKKRYYRTTLTMMMAVVVVVGMNWFSLVEKPE